MEDSYRIETLGFFDLVKNGGSLVLKSIGSKKIWELLKFMLSYKDKSFSPEALIDHLWGTEDYSDPRSTLRKQMHRLRQALECETPECSMILYTNGYYHWNKKLTIEIDAEVFEAKIDLGNAQYELNPELALKLYLEAIDLYKGEYCTECLNQHWVFPLRNQYRRLYLQTVQKAIQIMKNTQDYPAIIELCNQAIKIDMYEEVFHRNLIEAFFESGDLIGAFDHYQYMVDFLESNMGVGPSYAMRQLYKRMLKSQSSTVNQESLYELLEEDTVHENAFYCEYTVFKSFYEIEKRRRERTGSSFSVGIVILERQPKDTLSQSEIRMNYIKDQLMVHLRKGDTLTRWNENQLAVLLPGVNDETMKEILTRILGKDNQFMTIVVK